jgi:Methyltransferase domain
MASEARAQSGASRYVRIGARRVSSLARLLSTGLPTTVLDVTYRAILQRTPDGHARRDYLPLLRTGGLTAEQLGRRLIESEEFEQWSASQDLVRSLHRSRCSFVRSLPPARRILDLGGTNLLHDYGAMVVMGYPYRFDELVIVDLLPEDRHPIYDKGGIRSTIETGLGTVRYAYHSMTDLSRYDDESFDLVYSGQSIEHVPLDAADTMLAGALRVLRPGGWLAVDTPNARITRLQSDQFIDPDHKHEYTVAELSEKLTAAGFEIAECKGLNLGLGSLERKTFDVSEIAKNVGMFADAESSYLMAFLCRKP